MNICPTNPTADTSPRRIVGMAVSESPSAAGHNAFNCGGPSSIDLGRVKSEAQLKKDANRINSYSDAARNTNSDKTNAILGRRNSARSQ